nr:lytic transglycosylase domain-containing protein [Collimonas arenae]
MAIAAPAVPPHLTEFEELVAKCAPDIHPQTFKGVVTTESTFNPFAIGVVNGKLARTPRSQAEAVATAKTLEKDGFNFSLGLAQVNRYNLAKYGETYETIFEPCRNIKAGAAILKDCYVRAKEKIPNEQQALRASFSCYYSGNFTRGFRPDRPGETSYVQKVVSNALNLSSPTTVVPAVEQQSGDVAVAVRAVGRQPLQKLAKASQGGDWVSFGDVPQLAPAKTDELPPVVIEPVGKQEAIQVQRGGNTDSGTDAFVMVVD